MTLSTAEKAYYTARRNRALGFLKRLSDRYHTSCELHEKDVAECDAKLKEDERDNGKK